MNRRLPPLLLLVAAAGAAGQDAAGRGPADPGRVAEAGAGLPADVPDYYLSRLDIAGEVVGERADLRVSVVLFVTRPDVWQTVPLRMSRAAVLSREYVGEGEAAPVLGPDRPDGLNWSFRGAGRHELVLNVQVPLTRLPTGRQLEMTLPRLPEQFRGRLNLTIPKAPVEVTSEEFEVRPVSVLDGRTTVEGFIPGGGSPAAGTRLRVTWAEPVGEAMGTVGLVRTDCTLRPDVEAQQWRLTAEQRVRAVAGGLSVVRGRVPEGFALLDVEGRRVVDWESPAEGGGGWASVRLDNLPSPTADLTWRFAAPLDVPSDLSFTGLAVETARQQSGSLRVFGGRGVRLEVPWEEAEGVRRLPTRGGDAVAAAEYRQLPFRLPVRVGPERPYTVARPKAVLLCGRDYLELRHEVSVSVPRGRVTSLELEWPDARRGGWSLVEPLSGPGVATATMRAEGDRTRFTFASEWTEDLVFGYVARRPLRGEASTEVALPRVDASQELPTEFELLCGDGTDAAVSAVGETVLLGAAAEWAAAPPPPGTRRLRSASVQGLPGRLAVEPRRRKTELTASQRVTVTPEFGGRPNRLRLQTRQEIDYVAKYGRVSEVTLLLPEAARAGGGSELPAFEVDGRLLPPSALTAIQGVGVRISLMEESADFTLGVTHVPRPLGEAGSGGSGEWGGDYAGTVPILRPADATILETRVVLRRASAYAIRPEAEEGPSASDVEWIPTATLAADEVAWILRGSPADGGLDVVVGPGGGEAVPPYAAGRAEVDVRTTAAGAGVRASFPFDGPPPEVRVRLPDGCENGGFTWNGEGESATVRRLPGGVRLVAGPEGGEGPVRLEVSYEIGAAAPALVAAVELPLPTLLPRQPPAEVTLRLRDGRTLLKSPAELEARFGWRREGLLFVRRSEGEGGGYRFTSDRLPDRAVVLTAESRGVYVFGAMAGLAACVFCVFAPPRVRLFGVLGGGVAAAIGSVWLAEPMGVLAQPFALGAVLGWAAAALGGPRPPAAGDAVPDTRVDSGWSRPGGVSSVEATVIRDRSSVQT